MTLEEVTEKSRIGLPKKLSLAKAEGLLAYIAQRLPGKVNYQASYFRSIHGEQGTKISIHNGTISIAGSIVSHKTSGVFDSFEFVPYQRDSTMVSALQFARVPDWELSDYRPEVRTLWDDVRRLAEQYFKLEDH